MFWSGDPAPPSVRSSQPPKSLFSMPTTATSLSARPSYNRKADTSRYSAAHLQQAASFWIHDDGSSHSEPPSRHVFVGEHCAPMGEKLTRRRLVFITGTVTMILVIAAAIVGGILGSRAIAGGPPSDSPDSRITGTSGAGELVEALVNNGSQLATWFMPRPQAVGDQSALISQFLIFQDATGGLVVSEWYQDKLESYRLEQHLANLPKPVLGSQIQVISFGKAADLHIFYLDDKQVLRHLIRLTGQDSKVQWKLDPAFATDGLKQQVASGLVLSASVLPLLDNGTSDGLLGVLYWNGAKKNSFTLMTTTKSDALSGWSSMEVPIDPDPDQQAQELQDGSKGIVMVPIAVNIFGGNTPEGKLEPGVRIITDLSNKDHPASIGFVDCVLQRPDLKKQCWAVANITWKDETAKNRLLSAPKPLQITKIDIMQDQWGMPGSYLLGTLDGTGQYMESSWNGNNCTGSQVLSWAHILSQPDSTSTDAESHTSADDQIYSLGSFDNTKTGLIFAAPNGTLTEIGRQCGWWIGDCEQTDIWSLVGSLHAMVLKPK